MSNEEMTSKMQPSTGYCTVNREDLGTSLSCFRCKTKMADTSLVSRVRTTAGTRQNKKLRSVHFGVVVVESINCKCGGIVRNQIWLE